MPSRTHSNDKEAPLRRRSTATSRRTNTRRLTIKELPLDSRPREKLATYGAAALSEAELLGIVLRTGTQGENVVDLANHLLESYSGLGGLARASFADLLRMRGLGAAKVCQLLASLELATRLARSQTRQRVQVLTPEDLAPELMLDMGRLDHEVLRVVILDTKCRVLGATDLYRGTVESASLRVPELFKEAVRANATSLVLAHNHPSGDPTPSPEDLEVTKQAVNAGRLLQIEVLDHLVIGERSFLSLRRMHPDLFA